jgi:hypothetical protein
MRKIDKKPITGDKRSFLGVSLFDDKTITYRSRENKHRKKFNGIVDIKNLLENAHSDWQESLKFL